jgi:6-phospho-3-hexuloisomerase
MSKSVPPSSSVSTTEAAAASQVIVAELARLLERVDPLALVALVDQLLAARRVFVAGQGRSGLVASAFAIRLGHLGWEVHVAGEPSCPAIAEGDLLLAVSASGATAITLHQTERAIATGAAVAAISQTARSPVFDLAAPAVLLPPGDVSSAQHAGSLFEQGVLVLLDAVAKLLQDSLALPDSALRARHDNLQ